MYVCDPKCALPMVCRLGGNRVIRVLNCIQANCFEQNTPIQRLFAENKHPIGGGRYVVNPHGINRHIDIEHIKCAKFLLEWGIPLDWTNSKRESVVVQVASACGRADILELFA